MILENNFLKYAARIFLARFRSKCIFIDVSRISISDEKTGIQRVVRALAINLPAKLPISYKVEFVRLVCKDEIWQYEYANDFASEISNDKNIKIQKGLVNFKKADKIIVPDLFYSVIYANKQGVYGSLREMGVRIYFVVYDLLPISMPGAFFHETGGLHKEWLLTVLQVSDGLICTTKSVADEVFAEVEKQKLLIRHNLNIGFFWLGSDIRPLEKLDNVSDMGECAISSASAYTFLMVGTIDPRKGHLQVFNAFKMLWNKGLHINLVIVGKRDWTGSKDIERYDIPSLMEQLKSSKELGRHLFVLDFVDDKCLETLYTKATCLIAASEGEGFGLPIVEAALHRLPIIARDIAVFREVAGSGAYYFENSLDPKAISEAVENWIKLYAKNEHPNPDKIKCITWDKSAQDFVDLIFKEKWLYKFFPDTKLFTLEPNMSENHKSFSLLWESGWSHPEDSFRWNDGNKAVIRFFIDKEKLKNNMDIKLVLDVFEEQRVSIYLNKKKSFEASIFGNKIEILLNGSPLAAGENSLRFFLPDARLPGNGDSRKLAIAIREFVLSTNDPRK